MIPAALETRFQGRSLYILVVAAPKPPDYGATGSCGWPNVNRRSRERARFKASFPNKKSVAAGEGPDHEPDSAFNWRRSDQEDGHLEGIQVIRGASPVLTKAVSDDSMAWDFRPAT
jgi:hypothetical protein